MLTIGAAAGRLNLRPSAIRYYERLGILSPSMRLPNGYRFYDESAVRSLRFVLRCQKLGMSLKEIKEVLKVARSGLQPCGQIHRLANEHLKDIEREMRKLKAVRSRLQQLLRRSPVRKPDRVLCPLIRV